MTRSLLASWFAPISEQQFFEECLGRASVAGSWALSAKRWTWQAALAGDLRARVVYPAAWLPAPDAPSSSAFYTPEIAPLIDLGGMVLVNDPKGAPKELSRAVTALGKVLGSATLTLAHSGGQPLAAFAVPPGAFVVPLDAAWRWKLEAPLVVAAKRKVSSATELSLRKGQVLYAGGGARLLVPGKGRLAIVKTEVKAALEPKLRSLLMSLWEDDAFRSPALVPDSKRGRDTAFAEATDRLARLKKRFAQ